MNFPTRLPQRPLQGLLRASAPHLASVAGYELSRKRNTASKHLARTVNSNIANADQNRHPTAQHSMPHPGHLHIVVTFFRTVLRDVTANGLCHHCGPDRLCLHNRKLFLIRRVSVSSRPWGGADGTTVSDKAIPTAHFLICLSGHLMAQKFERSKPGTLSVLPLP